MPGNGLLAPKDVSTDSGSTQKYVVSPDCPLVLCSDYIVLIVVDALFFLVFVYLKMLINIGQRDRQ